MAFEKFKGAATRKAVGATVDGVLKYVNKDRVKGLNRLVDISEYLVGDLYPDAVFDGARRMIADPDNKWMKYVNSMLDDLDPHVVKTHILNIGYQAGFYGYAKTNRFEEEHGYRIPWIILMDPTSACNKHCIGCWSAEYGNRLNLSYEDLASIVRQGEELGIYFYMMTGGEPLVRKDDIIRLAREFPKSMFYAFTNGSLITDEFAETMRELGNIS
ncbi:radical SAM protein, partial [Faecalibaculum rodentium]